MITEKRQFGNEGEQVAVEYLLAKGYALLGRNVQASHHEVDIVMQDGEWLVFVEVKTRRSDYWSDPMRAVDDEKLWNLVMASNSFRHEHPEYSRLDFRIDVVCVVGDVRRGNGQPATDGLASGPRYRIEHYVDPFQRRIQARKPWKTHYRRLQKKRQNERYLKGWERMEKEGAIRSRRRRFEEK